MVGVLIGMKLAVLRNTATEGKLAWAAVGGTVGLCLAVANIVLAFFDFSQPRMMVDLLAVTFALWALGWMVGPAFIGEPPLNGQHFHRQPISRGTLATGLLASAMVAITTAVTFLAFTALIVFAARLSLWAVVVSLPAVILMLLLVVLLSRVVSLLFGALARSRLGGVITATVTGAMIAVASFSWVIFIGVYVLLEYGFPSRLSTVLQWLPSSWGLLSVEAAGRSDWEGAVGPLAALLALVVLLFLVWTRLLGPGLLARAVVRGSTAERAAPKGWAARSDLGVFYLKEMRTWWRDPLRTQNIVLPLAFSVISALFPLMLDFTGFFPFVGAATALMAAATCANLYGQDGTALWMTLLLPGKEKADVRARQLAWLTVFGPLTLVLTVAGSVLHGDLSLMPWALTANLAVLGGGVGLLIWISVVGLVPGPDPHKSKNSPLDHGDVTGQSFLMFFLTALAAAPALGLTLVGHLRDWPLLMWVSVPVGLLTGIVCYVWFGDLAARRLREKGPDLLQLMRSGKRTAVDDPETEVPSAFETMGVKSQILLWGSMAIGVLGLFPQGLVPLAIKVSGSTDRVWFLALYMPDAWQWPVIAGMIVLGLAGFNSMLAVYRAETRKAKEKARAELRAREERAEKAEENLEEDRSTRV
ncbi:hypothetical protein PJ985_22845 [Streptomyces sp. ACA25]|uniref:hypothetical protein n=1 Tax=Streptomyces sp. ACA25 TaxID=3022596 RepID=UPI0023077824|nr:hypothetical protein [Streptomyces sp. ACA25]MDB1090391.1 hypothetical protein [Streptomyces sp. ACA25]